jgi:3-methylcrotonyl-CoA carboxylase beta subunit
MLRHMATTDTGVGTDLRTLTAQLRERLARARGGGSPAAREKHAARGKLLARDRVDRLLDP